MPLIQPDTSEIQGAIEPGTYSAKITEVTPGVSKSGGQKIVVKFEVDVNGKHQVRQAHIPTSGAGAFGFDSLLRACHFEDYANKIKVKGGEKPGFDTDQLIGQALHLVIEADIYNGNVTDKIVSYLAA